MILKAITFNMCHGEGIDGSIDVRRQAMLLKKYKPDIIFLQEIDIYTKRAYNKNQIYTFSKYTGLPYRVMGTNIKYKNGVYGDGVLSRFPIEYAANYLSPTNSPEHEQRGFLGIKVAVGTVMLNLSSLHLSVFEEERILSSKALLRITSHISKSERIIIAGDFNVGVNKIGNHRYTFQAKDSYDEYEILKKKFQHLGNSESTWFSKDGSGCIDSCFFSSNLKLVKYETIPTEVSDHYPVYMEFVI